jgi:[glutamine synthetase] adenylyltransferase / [glutamine synthetase]-adenylyl-L-tyrosine phosphorylase
LSKVRPSTDIRQPPAPAKPGIDQSPPQIENAEFASIDVNETTAHIPFFDRATALALFSRLRQRVSGSLAAALPGLLAESPDPDSSLLLLERLVNGTSEEVGRLLNRHPSLAHYAIVVFGQSRFLGETLLQNSDLLQSFLRERNLDRSFSREEFHEALARFRSRSFETDISLLLARFKRREYVRIMLRDVLQLAPLAETTAEISALADILIQEVVREAESRLQRKFEPPQHLDAEGRLVHTPFTVLSLGKLGGNELNYSSDVDLMYIFGNGEEAAGARISNREYFIRLAQQVTEILARVTSEGPVFRIDMRLRPQGSEGELAVSLAHALAYYSSVAHDWERQALIKVRHSAGDEALARSFIRGVQKYVYSGTVDGPEHAGETDSLTTAKRLNFEAIATSLASREKMHTRRRTRIEPNDSSIDVKLDHGGIRDIEFLVQCLQRVYGGSEPWLRSGGTLFSLQKLHDKRHITGREFHDLTSAYTFLRHIEHRLQLREGRQTHRLPSSQRELQILQRSIEGYLSGEDRLTDVTAVVQRRMAAVSSIYKRVIHQQQSRVEEELPGSEFELRRPSPPAGVEQSHEQILARLAADSPAVFAIARRGDLSTQAQRALFRFLSSAFTSSERYASVLRHPDALEKALRLFECSEFLTEILVRHPEQIATLSEPEQTRSAAETSFLFERSGRNLSTRDPVFAYIGDAPFPYAEKLALLRQHFRQRVFAAGARDITTLRDVYESLSCTTAAAEDAIAAAYGIAGPRGGLAVLALGRLGTAEFDLLSDADVLFVCEAHRHGPALTRSAEQIMQTLGAYTRDGTVFPVDARLRPRGAEGELLVTPAQVKTYFENEAQPWEALMYTKLRFLTGSPELAEEAQRVTECLFTRFAADPGFAPAIRQMRSKLENAERGEKSFKNTAGGMYDIDFLTGYLLIKHRLHQKGGSARERIWRCADAGLLEKADAAKLDHAAELFRTVEHVVRLVVGRARKWLPGTEHARAITQELTEGILRRQISGGLERELMDTFGQVRTIYDRVMDPQAAN